MKIIYDDMEYDTSKPARLRRLSAIIGQLIYASDEEMLDDIRMQIEEATLVTEKDVDLYGKIIGGEDVEIFDFTYRDFEPNDRDKRVFYTFDDNGFFQLPEGEDEQVIIFKLIEKLLYDAKRRDRKFNDNPCALIRKLINKLDPETSGCDKSEYEEMLQAYREQVNDIQGDYASDDSDSEDEKAYCTRPNTDQRRESQLASVLQIRGELSRYRFKFKKMATKEINGEEKTPPPKLDVREKIHHAEQVKTAAQADLDRLNQAIRNGTVNATLQGLNTQFVVAQYRGIHYSTTDWSLSSRRCHRALDERRLPQYSLSVIKAAGFAGFNDYMEAREKSPDKIDKRLTKIADKLKVKLVKLRKSGAVYYKGYPYASTAHFLQDLYTTNYDEFHRYVKQTFQTDLKDYLLNEFNPFVSTGDIPRHALLYAYGLKAYGGHEGELLNPRYRKSRRPERPYSGKVYVSLHPLSDFLTAERPMHLPQMFWQGETKATSVIVSERETCFPAYIPAGRVVAQHIAKYPSFAEGGFRRLYGSKYGLTFQDMNLYRQAFDRFPLGSKQRVSLERILGEYFCGYQEARLIELAREQAHASGNVLIYRQNDGTFGFDVPKTVPPSNDKALWGEIKCLHEERKDVSPDTSDRIKPIYLRDARDTLFGKSQSPQKVKKSLSALFKAELKMEEGVVCELNKKFQSQNPS